MSSLIGLVTVLLSLCPSYSARVYQLPRDDAGPEIEINYLHVYTDIRFRYARTQIMSQLWNPAGKSQPARFWITIPKDAFITDFIIEIDGIRQFGKSISKTMAQRWYCGLKSIDEMIGIVKFTDDASRELNKYELKINLKADQSVNFTLAYEGQVDKISAGGSSFKYNLTIQVTPENMHKVKKFRSVIQIETNGTTIIPNIPNIRKRNNQGQIIPRMDTFPTADQTKRKIIWEPSSEEATELADEGYLGNVEIGYDVMPEPGSNALLVRDGYLIDLDRFSLKADTVPKHIIFVLDVSSSMHGKRLAQLKAGMKEILSSMQNTGNNYIDIIAFSDNITNWNPYGTEKITDLHELIPSRPDFIKSAMNFINNLNVHGATDIFEALNSALFLAKRAQNKTDNTGNKYPPTIIFFMTDGEPTSGLIMAPHILRRLKALNQDLKVPIYSLAFGSEADYELCKSISEQSGGLARKLFDNGDAAMRFQEFYNETISRSLQNITYKYISPAIVNKQVTHANFPQEYRHDIRSPGFPQGIVVDSTILDQPCGEKCFMERLHAFTRITRVHSLKHLARGAKDVCQTIVLNKRHPEYYEAIQLASKNEFVTRCTSLVVVNPGTKLPLADLSKTRTEVCD